MSDEAMREFEFYMSDPDLNGYYSSKVKIPEYDPEFDTELGYLLEQFKNFLKLAGYTETTVSRLQYLEDKEWKYVLTSYGEWKEEYEKFVKMENED